MSFTRRIKQISDIDRAATEWLSHFQLPAILCIYGDMGAGKTTFTAALCRALGTTPATSPTFSIINEYKGANSTVFHFDLYRINQPRELEDIGFEEYLNKNALVVIEWPHIAESILRHYPTIRLDLTVEENERVIHCREGDR